jgi:hypothetical protein
LVAQLFAFTPKGGNLFVTFSGQKPPMGEQDCFALSEDGRQWRALNGGKPVLNSTLGVNGVRDPFILRAHDGRTFCILAADLSIHLNRNWERAQEAGSQSIVIRESTDLVNWSPLRLVRVAAPEAGCTCAPEAVHDENAGAYMAFWVKSITMETSRDLMGPWRDVHGFTLAKMRGYEGPACYPLQPDANGQAAKWGLGLDDYSKAKGHQPFITEGLSIGESKPGPDFGFPLRHGSVLALSAAESAHLQPAFAKPASTGAAAPKPIPDGFTADPAIRVFDDTYGAYPTSDKPITSAPKR